MKKHANISSKKKTDNVIKTDSIWSEDQYELHADLNFKLPYQFLLLCKLMEVTPDKLLVDFMDNLSCSSWKREGRDKAKEKLIDYFIEHGYGQAQYTVEDIRSIFREMNAIGLLWPENASTKLIELHSRWRDKYHKFWFKKWLRKTGRK